MAASCHAPLSTRVRTLTVVRGCWIRRVLLLPLLNPLLSASRRQMEDKPSSQKRRKVEVEVEEEEDVLADLDDDELDPNQAEPEMMKCILPRSILLPQTGASHIPHLQRAAGST